MVAKQKQMLDQDKLPGGRRLEEIKNDNRAHQIEVEEVRRLNREIIAEVAAEKIAMESGNYDPAEIMEARQARAVRVREIDNRTDAFNEGAIGDFGAANSGSAGEQIEYMQANQERV